MPSHNSVPHSNSRRELADAVRQTDLNLDADASGTFANVQGPYGMWGKINAHEMFSTLAITDPWGYAADDSRPMS